MRKPSLVTSLFTLFAVAGFWAPATAATPQPLAKSTTQSGIALTPAIQDRVLGPNEKTVSLSVQLSNQTDKPLTFSLSTTDFDSLNQTGGLTFLGTDSRRVSDGHGLSGILELDARLVTLPANSSKAITVKITDTNTLAPGGHYGAVLAQVLPDGTAVRGNRVSVNQVVSSLLFIETAGEGNKNLTLLTPQISAVSFALPTRVPLVFKSTGNTQTLPRGLTTISYGTSQTMQGIVNENSSLLLPGSTRLFETELLGDRHPVRPGIYTLRVQYRYEGSLGVTVYEKRFLYLNVQAILLALLVIIVVSYGVVKSRKYWPALRKNAVVPATLQNPLIIVRNRSHAAHKVIVRRATAKKPKKTAVTDKTDL